LQENRIDLAYIMSVNDPGLFPSHFVSYEHLAVYVGPDHPLAGETSVTAADLRPYRTIRLGPNGHLRAAVDEVLLRCGLGMVGTGLETDDYGLILNTLQRTPCFAVMLKGQPDEALPTVDSYRCRSAFRSPLCNCGRLFPRLALAIPLC
jgi:DNA-binding transcriptional LysR family regulator